MGYSDDYDINKSTVDARMNSLVGTEEYLAPETLNDLELSYSNDYWSLGIILYQLLCGTTPFKGQSDYVTFKNIKNCHDITFTKPSIDAKAKDLIQQLLIKDPTMRLGFNDIEEIKQHEYFEGVEWSTIARSKTPYNPPKVRRPPRIS